jgi:IQ calmodulin-binding motif
MLLVAAFRRRKLLTRAFTLFIQRAKWKRHMRLATLAAVKHWRELCQARAFAGLRYCCHLERKVLVRALDLLERMQLSVTIREWLKKAKFITHEQWMEFEGYTQISAAATRLQSWWRGYISRRRILEMITLRTLAAIRIQTAWRGKAGRLSLRRLIRLRALKVREMRMFHLLCTLKGYEFRRIFEFVTGIWSSWLRRTYCHVSSKNSTLALLSRPPCPHFAHPLNLIAVRLLLAGSETRTVRIAVACFTSLQCKPNTV